MAESVLMKDSDYSSAPMDEDDPLMELSRIIGLEPRREPVARREPTPKAKPSDRIAQPETVLEAEDAANREQLTEAEPENALPQAGSKLELGDALQQDLAEELIASLESEDDFLADEPPVQFDDDNIAPLRHSGPADKATAADDEMAMPVLRISAATAAGAGSIEDELEALLNDVRPKATPFGLRPVHGESGDAKASPTERPHRGAYEDFGPGIVEPAAIQAQSADSRIDMNFDADPVTDAEEAPQDEPAWLSATADAAEEPEIIEIDAEASVRNGVTGAFTGNDARAGVHQNGALQDFAEEAIEADGSAQAEEPFERIIAAIQPEPVVESVQHEARTVDLIDDFEIPDFEYEDPSSLKPAASQPTGYDDDYAPAQYDEPAASKPSQPVLAQASMPRYDDADFDQINDAIAELETERHSAQITPGAAAIAAVAVTAASQRFENRGPARADSEDLAASLDLPQTPHAPLKRQSPGRSYLMAAGLGAIALLGGIGAYALTSGSGVKSTASAPVVLRAETEPVKIAPVNPGGKVVPNQDIAVYDKVAGAKPEATQQDKLVSKTEEPVDLKDKAVARVVLPGPSATQPDATQTAKAEDRVDASASDETSLAATEVATVSPKKVRTMVVKSDGSLVERAAEPAAADETAAIKQASAELPAKKSVAATKVQTKVIAGAKAADPAKPLAVAEPEKLSADAKKPAAGEELTVASAEPKPVKQQAAEDAVAPEAQQAAATQPPVKPVKLKKITQKAAKTEAPVDVAAAANIPLVDARPSVQPVNIVAKTGKTPAAEAPAAAPAAGGNYVIQIASAPSPDAAQSTYASLSRKFGAVIGGRAMNVQKADIPNKGTFYRVRIAAGSKAEAAALCTKYRAAGGQCLVAR